MSFNASYGPKHIAIPISAVSVGIRYNLKRESQVPHEIHKKSSFGPLSGNPNIQGIGKYPPTGDGRFPGTVNVGNHFQRVFVKNSNGSFIHPNI